MKKFDYPTLPPRESSRNIGSKLSILLHILSLAAIIALLVLVTRQREVNVQVASPASTWTASLQRKYAQRLVSRGLTREAVEAFREYLRYPGLTMQDRANILNTIGNLLFDSGDYSAALAAYYQAEIAGPSEDVQAEINRKVVACQERLGKTLDALEELKERTTPAPTARVGQADVVAQIGLRPITRRELFDQIHRIERSNPEAAKALIEDPRRQLEFLRDYIFTILVARKAERMGLDKTPAFRRRLEEMRRNALVNTFIEKEIAEKVSPDENDLELYYKANLEKFVVPARAHIRHILLQSEDEAKKLLTAIQKGEDFASLARQRSLDKTSASNGGALEQPIVEGMSRIPGIGDAPDLVEAVFKARPGQVIPKAIKSPAGFHVVKLERILPRRQLSFAEARDKVAALYRIEAQYKIFTKMQQELFQAEKVRIYEQAILGTGENENKSTKKKETGE